MELTQLRARIDRIDGELIELLEQRMDVSAEISDYKRAKGLAVLDAHREVEKLESVRAACRAETGSYIAAVFEAVLASSRSYQTARMEKHG